MPQSELDLLDGEVGHPEVQLAVGASACVWNHFLRCWTGGFAVVEVLTTGYRLRRLSDRDVFDDVFSSDEVMEERRKIHEPGIGGTTATGVGLTPWTDFELTLESIVIAIP